MGFSSGSGLLFFGGGCASWWLFVVFQGKDYGPKRGRPLKVLIYFFQWRGVGGLFQTGWTSTRWCFFYISFLFLYF